MFCVLRYECTDYCWYGVEIEKVCFDQSVQPMVCLDEKFGLLSVECY